MNLDKAKEFLSLKVTTGDTAFDHDFRAAQKLGIEAINRLQAYRLSHTYIGLMKLPGED